MSNCVRADARPGGAVGETDPDDVAALVGRAAAGEAAAWDAIVERFGGLVWAVAGGYRLGPADTAEVAQTTWLRLLENLDRIREPARLGGWLATTARREALRMLRMRAREIPEDGAELDVEVDPGPTPEEAVLDGDRDRRIWQAFTQLPERCRVLLHLVVVVAPPYAEVAAALDLPVGSIGPSRARCLRRLRKLYQDGASGSADGEGADDGR
ncbi:RNA polymerase sigma factor [Pseudonocardia lacus]|uniref:RNA polymerase sigma factor n=1 Tax=Pseudonocardia lacus TaxID=2835865 RepID=UPI001BDBF533|nr:sigma-70 family RNA polymerase sigma factor [Pseudonocardia lacus]